MTEFLQLDLLADGEGLLVPFGKAMEKADSKRNDPNPLFAPPPVQKKRRGLFFRRSRENQPEESKDNGNENLAEKLVKTKQGLTFSFPNAPLEYAEQEQPLAPVEETGKESCPTEKTQSSEEEESEEESSEEDESEEGSSEDGQENRAPVKPDNPNPNAHDEPGSPNTKEEGRDLKQDDSPRPKMDGFGNSQPQNDSTVAAVGRLFRHLRRTGEMKTMKVATEATKDEKTIGETVTHCLQVAIAPEIYAEDMEGEDNLGFYRVLRPPKPLSETEKALQSMAKWKEHSMQLRMRVKQLLARIHKLEGDLKSKDLEAMSWKLRARELENQLKQCRGGDNDDDSSVDPKAYENRQSESEIDHEWKEDGLALVKEEILVDTDIANEKIEFDPLSKTKGGPTQSKDNEDESKDLVDLILSLSADVDTFKAGKAAPNENHENTSSPKMPGEAIVVAV